MICIKCGLTKRGEEDFFICEDCKDFSKIVDDIYADIDTKMETLENIDPDTNPIFRLLSDSSFVTAQNPQTAIFYKLCEFIVARALNGVTEITEDELNREIRTTRAWSDAFKVFEELNLVKVKTEKYRRVLILTDKTKKFANQYLDGEPLSEQIRIRLAHIYAGYVLLYILKKIAELDKEYDITMLPYKQRPRTLWTILMFLWATAYNGREKFTEEDLRAFISRRRIPSITRGRIIRSLQTIDGKFVQGLIKDMSIVGGNITFKFEDYVMVEMERVRERIRERER